MTEPYKLTKKKIRVTNERNEIFKILQEHLGGSSIKNQGNDNNALVEQHGLWKGVRFLETVFDTHLGARVMPFEERELHLQSQAEILLKAYITTLDEKFLECSIGPRHTEKEILSEPLAILREILIRWIAIALADEREQYGGLRIIEEIKKILGKLPSKLIPDSLNNFFISQHAEWLESIKTMISFIYDINSHKNTMSNVTVYLKNVKKCAMRQLVTLLDSKIKKGYLSDNWLEWSFMDRQKNILNQIKDCKAIVDENAVHDIAPKSQAIVIQFFTKKYGKKKPKILEKIKQLYQLINQTNLALKIVNQFDSMIVVGGWLIILGGIINFQQFQTMLSEYAENATEVLKIRDDSKDLFSESAREAIRRYGAGDVGTLTDLANIAQLFLSRLQDKNLLLRLKSFLVDSFFVLRDLQNHPLLENKYQLISESALAVLFGNNDNNNLLDLEFSSSSISSSTFSSRRSSNASIIEMGGTPPRSSSELVRNNSYNSLTSRMSNSNNHTPSNSQRRFTSITPITPDPNASNSNDLPITQPTIPPTVAVINLSSLEPRDEIVEVQVSDNIGKLINEKFSESLSVLCHMGNQQIVVGYGKISSKGSTAQKFANIFSRVNKRMHSMDGLVHLQLWDVNSEKPKIIKLKHHKRSYAIRALVLSPDSKYLICACSDTTISIWNIDNLNWDEEVSSMEPISILKGHIDSVRSLALLSSGELISGSYDKTLRVWNYKTGACINLFRLNKTINVLKQISEQYVIAGGQGSSVADTLWVLDVKNNFNIIKTLNGHTDEILNMVLLKNNNFITCSKDKEIRIWTNQFSCIRTLIDHTAVVRALAVYADRYLFSGGDDKTLMIWDLKTYKCIAKSTYDDAITAIEMVNNEVILGFYQGNTMRAKLSDFKLNLVNDAELLPNVNLMSSDNNNTLQM